MLTMLMQILDLIFPKTKRERTVERLARNKLTLRLIPSQRSTTAGIKVTTLTEYDSPRVRELVHSLKFHNSRAAAHVLARVLHDYLAESMANESTFGECRTLILPVPISQARRRERGFNQIERMLTQLVKIDKSFKNLVRTDVLMRTRHTTPQTKLGRAQRLKNLRGAFSVAGASEVRRAHAVVVDDIVTTGATLAEIKSTLEASGCKQVTLLAIARA